MAEDAGSAQFSSAFFSQAIARGVKPATAKAVGYVSRVVGLTLEARGINLALGARAMVSDAPVTTAAVAPTSGFEVEVVGFDGRVTYLMPLRPIAAVRPGASVTPVASSDQVPAGEALLGRVIDGTGQPLDNAGPLIGSVDIPFHPQPINPLQRHPIEQPLDVGVRSVNASLTIGCGQRVGLFAGSGVGKSVLLGMMTRFTEAEVVIVALVGERGREVREFVETNLGPEGMRKTIVVAAPADETPVMRLRAGMYAARLAEYFRDAGKRTLLLFDSLTRYAQAQREIALATGEPPATRGYPPSVFARLPQLVERAGNGTGNGGSVTAFYTVLVEGDDLNDPVADASRAILDGHVVLSRDIAGAGIYPAVDIQASISRSMATIVDEQHLQAANQIKRLYARYEQSKDLISVGAYTAGIDAVTDTAIALYPRIQAFLSQSLNERVDLSSSIAQLMALIALSEQGDAQSIGQAQGQAQSQSQAQAQAQSQAQSQAQAQSQGQAPFADEALQGEFVAAGQQPGAA